MEFQLIGFGGFHLGMNDSIQTNRDNHRCDGLVRPVPSDQQPDPNHKQIMVPERAHQRSHDSRDPSHRHDQRNDHALLEHQPPNSESNVQHAEQPSARQHAAIRHETPQNPAKTRSSSAIEPRDRSNCSPSAPTTARICCRTRTRSR